MIITDRDGYNKVQAGTGNICNAKKKETLLL